MIDNDIQLTVKTEISSVFNDVSNDAVDYLRDSFTATLDTPDYLYMGYSKPFNAVFVEIQTVNSNVSEVTMEVYDGISWAVTESFDQTRGFSRSGFVNWSKVDMASIEIDGVEAFYVRIKVSAVTSSMDIRAANLVLSDDQALKQEFFEVDQLLVSGQTSHISKHVAARNDIIQYIRNDGNLKTNSSGVTSNINVFDLHESVELRQAATYLALAKIFFNLSDSLEDNWFIKFREYTEKYKTMMAMYRVSIDLDDDGVDDESNAEKVKKPFIWSR